MSEKPALVFVPGAWHKPQCYDKAIKTLQDEYSLKCISIALPSTSDNTIATLKDDIDTTRNAITTETTAGRDVIVIAHSYGGMVGNSAIKGLMRPRGSSASEHGYVTALMLIASGFAMTGLSFMAPFLNMPPPFWRANKETGYAELTVHPRELFYHDLPQEEGEYWVSQLKTHSLKSLLEGGEHAYAGWKDVPTWYIGTVEDHGLPIVVQRMQVGAARGLGGVVHHTDVAASHSPFLNMSDEVVAIILQAAKATSGAQVQERRERVMKFEVPTTRLVAPGTWFRFGIPLFIGRVLGWSVAGYYAIGLFVRRR